jgi:hypothetical protein
MSMIQSLGNNAFAKKILVGLLAGTVVFTVAAEIYLRFHFAAAMPRSPDPLSGRTYRTMAVYGSAVYVNKQELDRVDFVNYDLMSVSGIFMLVLFYLKARLKWF